MNTKIVILIVLLTSCNGLSIGVSENVNSETRIGDAFPDWVPFKNKHGDELGQFVPVTKKIKKRLAQPMNFILRAVAESDDDYFDKGQGGSDSEDNYENKDWSDLHRPAVHVNKNTNHTEISDIDSVVEIITNHPPNPIADAINSARTLNAGILRGDPDEYDDEEKTTEIPKVEKRTKKPKKAKEEDDADYDESSSEKQKSDPAEDVSESEAKKARILDGVDELKLRHQEESKSLSEKVEEEMYKEEFERNRQHPVIVRDKYESRKKYKKVVPDYDEYEDKNASLENKYKVIKLERSTQPSASTSYLARKEKNKHVDSGKLSVFKNPQFYMVYDDAEETTIAIPTTTSQKYSSRYTTAIDNDDERISLVPEDSKEGEPTLFFPKKRKSRRRKAKTTMEVSETTTEIVRSPTVAKADAIDTTAADSKTDAIETAPSSTGSDVSSEEITTGTDVTITGSDESVTSPLSEAVDLSPTSTDVMDTVPADTKNEQKEEEKTVDYHREKGGGSETHAEEEEEEEEEGKKSYKAYHEDTKTAIGHHDKDNHLGKYEDRGGVDKHHIEESGHYGDHEHEEYGKKHAEYEESGKHSKGHNTKGSHDVHKKEEYEKKVEFFEEDGDSAEEERFGGYKGEKGHSQGGRFKKGNLNAGHLQNAKGESGHYEEGGHKRANKGHKQATGHDSHGKHEGHHSGKFGKEGGRRWVFHHGSPARTANLVVIDRRADQMYHGPQYYG